MAIPRNASQDSNTKPLVSIVIPVLNESVLITKHLSFFSKLHSSVNEVIFVDGGSTDDTVAQLSAAGYCVVSSLLGRANQMNAGAAHARADSILFLHADIEAPNNFKELLSIIPRYSWGFFKVRLRHPHWVYRLVSSGINMRARLFQVATGDQGIFVKKALFNQLGGFPSIELMEDVALSRMLKKHVAPKEINEYLHVSARRWELRGVMRTIFLMWGIQLAYMLGVSPKRLANWYR